MNIEEKLKFLSKTKQYVSFLKKEYDCDIKQAEMIKKLGLTETSEKCFKGAEEVYQEIQANFEEYKRLIAAVKSIPGNKGKVLQLLFFEGKSTDQAAKELGYNVQYIRRLKNSGIKWLEENYGESNEEI